MPSNQLLKLSVEQNESSLLSVNPSEQAGLQPQSNSTSSKQKAKRSATALRRSERVRNAVLPYQSCEMEHAAEEINICDSEKDEPQANPSNQLPPASGEKSLEEKVDHLVQLVKAQENIIKSLQSKVSMDPHLNGSSPEVEARYKALYIKSQKQVEELRDKNNQLSQKLEMAHCKLEVHEKGSRSVSEVLEKLRDVILITNLAKAAEAAINASCETTLTTSSPDADGRRKHAAKRKK